MPAEDRAPPAPAARGDLGLDELLRMMDVATALRRERERAAAELDIDQIQAALRRRLRATAEATGEPVTDAEIDAAIEQFYARQHEFRPAERSWSRFLARLYVRRAPILGVTAVLLGAFFLTWWLVSSTSSPFSSAGREARALAAEEEAADDATAQLRSMVAGPAAKARCTELLAKLQRARESRSTVAIRTAMQKIRALNSKLRQEYELHVVSRPGERSAVFRNFDDEKQNTRRLSGYYLIVEARNPTGQLVQQQIVNGETKRTKQVSRWAEQVDASVYNRLAADKKADGIVDESLFARKRRGYLELEIVMPGPDGKTPLTRGRQITEW